MHSSDVMMWVRGYERGVRCIRPQLEATSYMNGWALGVMDVAIYGALPVMTIEEATLRAQEWLVGYDERAH